MLHKSSLACRKGGAMSVFTSAVLALRSLYHRLLERSLHPEAMLVTAISGLEEAGRKLRLHLAEVTMALGRTQRQLVETTEEGLRHQLSVHANGMIERLGQLRLQLADLDAKVLQLKALQTDLRLRRDLTAVRDRLQHILGELVTHEEDPLAEVAGALSYHQELRSTLAQLKHGGYLR